MSSGKSVFISHITDEAAVADALKVHFQRCFGPSIRVFVSSDYESIATGEEWYRAIVKGITEADVVIVLLSRYSVDQRWINFESGLARGANIKFLPLTFRGFQPGEVGLPLSQFHLRALVDELTLEGVVRAIADAAGLEILSLDGLSAFIAQLEQIEASLPVKSILLEPVIQNQSGGPLLRFRLSNTGNRDVELIEIEVRVPEFIVQPNWRPQRIPNVFSVDSQRLGEVQCWIIREQPFEGTLDVMRYGSHTMLPRIVSPYWTPRFSDALKVPIRSDLEYPEKWFVEYKVVAHGLYVPGRKGLTEIPVLP